MRKSAAKEGVFDGDILALVQEAAALQGAFEKAQGLTGEQRMQIAYALDQHRDYAHALSEPATRRVFTKLLKLDA